MREAWESLSVQAREDSFRRGLPGAIDQVELQVSDPEDWTRPLRVDYALQAGEAPRTTDERVLLLPTEHMTSSLFIPIQEARHNPIWLPFQYVVSQITTFELPEGLEIPDRLPEGATITGPGHEFRYSWNRNPEGELVWTGVLDVLTTRIDEARYDALVDFLADVRKALKKGVMAKPTGSIEEASR